MMFKRIIPIGIVIIVLAATAGVCFAQDLGRDDLISHELDCVSSSLESGDGVSWNDICYTWDNPQGDDRDKLINDMLNYHEGTRAMREPAPPSAPSQDYSDMPYSQTDEIQPSRSLDDGRPEAWLKNEYPYFYKEHMIKKRTNEDYYSDYEKEHQWMRLDEDDGAGPSILPLLRLIDFGFTVESNRKPSYYLEGVFPLFESASNEHTIFTHDRVSVVSGQNRDYSIGFGYRFFDQEFEIYGKDFPYIVGSNIFYDFQENGDHYRVGYGLEFMSDYLEGRANYYNAFSPVRTLGEISVDVANLIRHVEREQAVDGFDLELGLGIPQLSIAKLYGGFERYDHKHSDDEKAWTGRLELKPTNQITLNFKYINDEDEKARYRFDGRFNFDFSSFDPKDIMADINGLAVHAAHAELKDRLTDRVERNFEIKVERWRGQEGLPNLVGNLQNVQLVVRFPGVVCADCFDDNGDGFVQAGDGFEIDFLLFNSSSTTSTGIAYSNAVSSPGWPFVHNNNAILPDAPPGGTTQTDENSDMDLNIPDGTPDGTSFTITLDFEADGESLNVTFGPFVVGQIQHGQVIDVLSFN